MTNKDSKQVILDLTAIEGNPKVHTAKDFIDNPTEEKQKMAESLARAVEMINNNTQLRETFDKTVDSLKQLATEYTKTSNVYKSFLIDSAKNNPEFYYKIIEQVIDNTLDKIEQEETSPIEFNDFTECINFFNDMLTNELTIAKDYNLDFNHIATILRHSFNRLGIESTQLTAELLLSRLEAEEEAKHKFNLHLHMFGEEPELKLLEQNFKKPDKYMQEITLLGNKIFNPKTSPEDLQQAEIKIVGNKPYYTLVDINIYDNVTTSNNLAPTDWSVFNAVISITRLNNVFTSKQVAMFLTYGDIDYKGTLSKQKIGNVTRSIEKMRTTTIDIDWTDHAKLCNRLNEGESFKSGGYMLPVETFEFKSRGQKVKGYRLIKHNPPLLDYAESVGQINNVDASLLNVPINLDENKTIARDYLIRLIGGMKNPKSKLSHTIKYDTVLEHAGMTTDNRTQRKRNIDAIEHMLDDFKSKGFIKGYKVNKQGNSKYSITIQP